MATKRKPKQLDQHPRYPREPQGPHSPLHGCQRAATTRVPAPAYESIVRAARRRRVSIAAQMRLYIMDGLQREGLQ